VLFPFWNYHIWWSNIKSGKQAQTPLNGVSPVAAGPSATGGLSSMGGTGSLAADGAGVQISFG